MNKLLLQFAGIAVGVVAAIAIIAFWRSHSPHAAQREPGATRATPAELTASEPVDDAAAQVLAAFERSLFRASARAREALLAFKDDAALQRFLDRAQQNGLTVVDRLDGTVRVRYANSAALRNELRRHAADYADVSANSLVNIPQAPAREDRAAIDQVPFRNDALAFLGVAGDHSQWGRGTTIAILDTGIAADATFGAGRVTYLDIGLGTAPGSGREDGHGTSVASLAAGAAPDAPGVAPAANLLSIRVTDASGVSDIFTIAKGIVAAVDAGAKIVNVSLGGYATNSALNAAISYASDRGAVIVAAAGNDQASQLAWPAADTRVVSVGAVDRVEQQVTFSNSGTQLQLTAPGYGVQTAWLGGQRAYVDGTSASAPLVAGALAAVISQNPSLTPPDALALLTRTASDAGAPGADPAYGNGILNLGWAMNANTPGYVDTAVSNPYFDAASSQVDFVVQNRSSQAVSGLSLAVNGRATPILVPALRAGESYVARIPLDPAMLNSVSSADGLPLAAELVNPVGVIDRVPANNRRAGVLKSPRTP